VLWCLQEVLTGDENLTVPSVADSSSSISQVIATMKSEKSPTASEKKLPYECRVCDESFAVESQLTEHLYRHIESTPTLETIELSDDAIAVKLYDCTWCYMQFDSTAELTEHLVLHGDRRPHVCHCGRRLASADKLAAHRLIHAKKTAGRRQRTGNETFSSLLSMECFIEVCQSCTIVTFCCS